jgi:hypothetical protein
VHPPRDAIQPALTILKRPWARGRWKVDHRTAVSTIYKASIALWLFGALHAVIDMAQHTRSQWISPEWADLIALVVAVALTILGGWLVERERQKIGNRLRRTAAEAVKLAENLEMTELADSEEFRSLCEELAGTKADIVQTRARFLSQLQSEAITHYVTEGSAEWTAAQTVAVITDLAPEWLYDSATSRRRPV